MLLVDRMQKHRAVGIILSKTAVLSPTRNLSSVHVPLMFTLMLFSNSWWQATSVVAWRGEHVPAWGPTDKRPIRIWRLTKTTPAEVDFCCSQVLVPRDEKATRGFVGALDQSGPFPNPTPCPDWTPSPSLMRALTASLPLVPKHSKTFQNIPRGRGGRRDSQLPTDASGTTHEAPNKSPDGRSRKT